MLIEANNVTKAFGSVPVLKGVSTYCSAAASISSPVVGGS